MSSDSHVLIIGVASPFDVVPRVLVPRRIFQFTLPNRGGRTVLKVECQAHAVRTTFLGALSDACNPELRARVKKKGVVYFLQCRLEYLACGLKGDKRRCQAYEH